MSVFSMSICGGGVVCLLVLLSMLEGCSESVRSWFVVVVVWAVSVIYVICDRAKYYI